MAIHIRDILNFEELHDYKVHVATNNGREEPLDVFVSSKERWQKWSSWKSTKNDFNRKYIFSIMDYYHEPNVWLFGGVFEVIKRFDVTHDIGYQLKLTDQFKPFIGRLKIHWKKSGRAKSRMLESCINEFTVSEILNSEYTGEVFCGYENINHTFKTLEHIFKTSKKDWKAALSSIKGVYLIMDKSNGFKYIGAAYGTSGIWSRWSSYLGTGHGDNTELSELIDAKGLQYARENFIFSLLEYRPKKTDDYEIRARESYWKRVFLSSRKEFGYNGN